MIEITFGPLENLVVAVARGKVTAADYENSLIPAIEEKLKTHKKLRLLYQLAEDFTGFTPGAVWDDAKLGLSHWSAFEAIAVVTDIHWVADAVKFFGVFIRCPVKLFTNTQVAEAREWVSTAAWKSLAEVESGS